MWPPPALRAGRACVRVAAAAARRRGAAAGVSATSRATSRNGLSGVAGSPPARPRSLVPHRGARSQSCGGVSGADLVPCPPLVAAGSGGHDGDHERPSVPRWGLVDPPARSLAAWAANDNDNMAGRVAAVAEDAEETDCPTCEVGWTTSGGQTSADSSVHGRRGAATAKSSVWRRWLAPADDTKACHDNEYAAAADTVKRWPLHRAAAVGAVGAAAGPPPITSQEPPARRFREGGDHQALRTALCAVQHLALGDASKVFGKTKAQARRR